MNNIPKLKFKEFTNNTNKWKTVKLQDIVTWKRGKKLAKKELNTKHEGNPVIHYADLYKFNPVENTVIHWSTSSEGVLIPHNSLLFPMSDVTPTGLATTTTMIKDGIKASGDTLIGTIKQGYDARFISFYLNYHPYKILRLVTGTTVRHINAKSLNLINMKVPPLNEQKQIADFFIDLEKMRFYHIKETELLKKLEKGYAQKIL